MISLNVFYSSVKLLKVQYFVAQMIESLYTLHILERFPFPGFAAPKVNNFQVMKPTKISHSGFCNLETVHLLGFVTPKVCTFWVSDFLIFQFMIFVNICMKSWLISLSPFSNPESVHFSGYKCQKNSLATFTNLERSLSGLRYTARIKHGKSTNFCKLK